MGLMIRDMETIDTIRRLARKGGRTEEEVVRAAVEAEVKRQADVDRIVKDVKQLQDEYAAWPSTGLKADKAFFDDLGGGL